MVPSTFGRPALPANSDALSGQQAPSYSARDFQWLMVALFLLWFHATMDRQLLSIYLGGIGAEFALSDTQLGLLSGFAFAVGYAIGVVPAGHAGDRVQPKYVIAAGTLIWVASTLCGFLVTTYQQLFFARIGVGIGEAVLTPVGFALISEFTSPADRPKATSVVALGRSLGIAGSLALPSALILLLRWTGLPEAAHFGTQWRVGFLATALLGIFLVPVSLAIPTVKRLPATVAGSNGAELVRFLIDELPFAIPFVVGISLFGMVQTGLQTWLPLFFQRTYSWDTAEVSRIFGLIQLLAGISGTILTGLAAAYLNNRHARDLSLALLAWITAAAIPVAIVAFTPIGASGSLVGVTLLYAYTQVGFVLSPVVVMAAVPLRFRARTLGLYGLVNSVAQYALGPLIYGLVADLAGVSPRHFWLPCLITTVTLLTVSSALGFALVKPHRLRSGRT